MTAHFRLSSKYIKRKCEHYKEEAAITCGFPGKPDIPKMNPDQAITLKEALVINTINGAWSLRMEDEIGTIETGKYADMIILNHNLFEIPATDIHKTEVLSTVFNGKEDYKAN